jgi:TRAP transporter TAXI family solute receptor
MKTQKSHLRRRKVSQVLTAIFMLSFALVDLAAPSLAEAGSWKWPETFVIGTPGVGSSSYISTSSWAPVLEEQTQMKVRVVPQDSAASRAKSLRMSKIDAETESLAGFAGEAMEARVGYASRDGGPFQARILWPSAVMYFSFMVRGDSDIHTIYDLKKGKRRIAITPNIPGIMLTMKGVLAWLNLTEQDVVMVPFGSYKANILSPSEGRADFAGVTTTAAATFQAASNPHGVRFIPLPYKKDPEGARRLLDVRPTLMLGKVRDGVKESLDVQALIMPFFYYVRSDMSNDLAYNLAKWFDEQHIAYKDKHKVNKAMSITSFRDLLDQIYFPVHEGVIKYFREKKMWASADDLRQKENLELLTRYVEAYKAAVAEADKKGIEVNPTNEDWMKLWSNFKEKIPVFRAKL